MKTFDIIAKTLFGFEEVLAEELKNLGAKDIRLLTRAVQYKGDLEMLYKSNLHLRSAIKILKPIASFEAANEHLLYQKIKEINWSEYLSPEKTFAIDAIVSGEIFTHSKYVALKSKDAIADQFRDNFGERPSIELNDPDLRINIHIADKSCSVSLDSSGNSLGKRGYKTEQTFAPLSEVLAAGMILMTGWEGDREFIDPMAGSGTIPIEAALIAANIAPGSFRHFTFEKWKDFDPALWSRLKTEAEAMVKSVNVSIKGFDLDKKATRIQQENARRAGVENIIHFETLDFFKVTPETENSFILMNPPYGERLEEKDEMVDFYQQIGDHLKQSFNGCDAWILSGNLQAIKHLGLRPSRKTHLYNGPIECRLHKFELYRGSKKASKQDNTDTATEQNDVTAAPEKNPLFDKFKRR